MLTPALLSCTLLGPPQELPTPVILPLRQQAALRDEILAQRLDTLVPQLMREEAIDLWILIAREYNEDPVVRTMLPATWLSARRRTVLVFHEALGVEAGTEAASERLAVSRYAVGNLFPAAWDPGSEPDQWKRLAQLIAERDPQRIALDVSPDFAHADGLSHSEHEALVRALPEVYRSRLVSAERLALGWLERRSERELELYPAIVRIAHSILAEALSERVIQPGATSTEDIVWWLRERVRGLGLETWFHPSVSLQRHSEAPGAMTELFGAKEDVVRHGDLVHIDFGITYLGLNTDTQQHAYVLRPGETEAPAGLRQGLRDGNRLQDLLTGNFVSARSGNEILAATLEAARAEGLRPTIYTHPLGYHGHGAGPTIGLWDQQGGVPGKGDAPLVPRSVHSIELNVRVEVPEWDGTEVLIMLEEDALFDGAGVRYLDGRQEFFHLVP